MEIYSPYKYNTDKESSHRYISRFYSDFFENLLNPTGTLHLAEIGVLNGSSIRLWHDWAAANDIPIHIHGYDLNIPDTRLEAPNIQYTAGDFYKSLKDNTFATANHDILIDDGPHTLESHITLLSHALFLIRPHGHIIIEDIPDTEHLKALKSFCRGNNRPFSIHNCCRPAADQPPDANGDSTIMVIYYA